MVMAQSCGRVKMDLIAKRYMKTVTYRLHQYGHGPELWLGGDGGGGYRKTVTYA